MAHVTAEMRTLDLRNAEHTPVEGSHVWKLQMMLNVFAQSGDEDPVPALLVTDGIAGPATRKALLHFQDSGFGLTPDGIAGPLTWQRLLEFDVAGQGHD
jgi:peptidoglycan hydrolase-like protein with peptidoglycan-binding domain